MKRSNSIENEFINELLTLSKEEHSQNVTIICMNGTIRSNCLILASIFPVFKNVIDTIQQYDDSIAISIPDVEKNELEDFLMFLHRNHDAEEEFSLAGSIYEFSKYSSKVQTIKTPKQEDLEPQVELIKEEEIEDASNYHQQNLDLNLLYPIKHSILESNVSEVKPEILSTTKQAQSEFKVKRKRKDAKPECCPHCGFIPKCFTASNLKRHIETHFPGTKPVVKVSCHICGKVVQKGSLQFHIKSHDQMPGTFVCPDCGKGFKNARYLKDHVDSEHKGIKKYSCDQCGFRTNRSDVFKIHMIDHTGIFPHNCSTCGKGFKTRGELNNHEDTHLPDEQKYKFSCQFCGSKFTRKVNLDVHIKSQHSNKK